MIRFKLDEDPFQRRISFLTFIDSLDMVFSQYRETCEVLLDYPKIGGDDVKDYTKQAIRKLLHANIDVHSRRLIAEFPKDGVKCIGNFQSHCANMTFADMTLMNLIHLRTVIIDVDDARTRNIGKMIRSDYAQL